MDARYIALVQSGELAPNAQDSDGDPTERAGWAAVFEAARHTRHAVGVAPKATLLQDLSPGTRIEARACEALLRAFVAGQAQEDLAALMPVLLRETQFDTRAEVVATLGRAWHAWWNGDDFDIDALTSAHKVAVEAKMASLVIESMAVRALIELRDGDVDSALRRARRASRMSRTEGIPYAEILANLALVRVRRVLGAPHLALRILGGIERYAPPIWRPWITWEAMMAGRWQPNESAFWPVLAYAEQGHAEALRQAGQAYLEGLPPAPLAHDARVTLTLLCDEVGDASLEAWRCGETNTLPSPLQGLAFARPSSDLAAFRTWIAFDRAGARRVAHLEFHLACARGYRPLTDSPQPRADQGIALLALAAKPLAKEAYFRQLYGFDYDGDLHASMFSMHLGRVRERLADHGELESEHGMLRLVAKAPVLLPDPRCVELLPQRALRVLAEHPGGLSSRALAAALGATLRSAQRALRGLVEEGAVEAQPKGRGTLYRVEDTTFSEPTMSRRFTPSVME